MNAPSEIAGIEGLTLVSSAADPCVYFLVRGDVVVYVGQTIRLWERLKQHRSKDYDRAFFVRCQLEEMNAIERRWITELEPELNVQFVPKLAPIDRLDSRTRGELMFAARGELAATMGIGKNAPKPDQILARMTELLAESRKKGQSASVTDPTTF